jgi:hypothetical protein
VKGLRTSRLEAYQKVGIKPTTLGRLYGHFDQAKARERHPPRVHAGAYIDVARPAQGRLGLSHELRHKGPISAL